MFTNLSHEAENKALVKLGVIAASGRPLAWVRTFGGCAGLATMRGGCGNSVVGLPTRRSQMRYNDSGV